MSIKRVKELLGRGRKMKREEAEYLITARRNSLPSAIALSEAVDEMKDYMGSAETMTWPRTPEEDIDRLKEGIVSLRLHGEAAIKANETLKEAFKEKLG